MTGVMEAMGNAERYPRTSRYHGVPQAVYVRPDGQQVPYTTRRPLPDPAKLFDVASHLVVEHDRLDLLANTYIGDPEQWWQIADANPALASSDLTATPGRRLRITSGPANG